MGRVVKQDLPYQPAFGRVPGCFQPGFCRHLPDFVGILYCLFGSIISSDFDPLSVQRARAFGCIRDAHDASSPATPVDITEPPTYLVQHWEGIGPLYYFARW